MRCVRCCDTISRGRGKLSSKMGIMPKMDKNTWARTKVWCKWDSPVQQWPHSLPWRLGLGNKLVDSHLTPKGWRRWVDTTALNFLFPNLFFSRGKTLRWRNSRSNERSQRNSSYDAALGLISTVVSRKSVWKMVLEGAIDTKGCFARFCPDLLPKLSDPGVWYIASTVCIFHPPLLCKICPNLAPTELVRELLMYRKTRDTYMSQLVR